MPDDATPDPRPKLTLLNDTITRAFRTVENDDGWPVVAGEVRPAMPREVSAYSKRRTDAQTAKNTDLEDRVRAEFYARHVRAWDVLGVDGLPAPVTPEAMLALPYPVWLQLEAIVVGFTGGDVAGKSVGSPAS